MTDQTPHATDSSACPEQHRSPLLAVFGVLALIVAGWGFAGGPDLGDAHAAPWAILIVGVVAGVGLVVSGIRRR
ncbi:hypothetical protein [Gordonia zhaorongruii]|uniref:hypothetical protein n=1 Tax=Gordonia zhaorongruii TaxID=2597659 RepID=UPI00104BDED4|nr:hypothetical protein [Gordonia zhaorongruii]